MVVTMERLSPSNFAQSYVYNAEGGGVWADFVVFQCCAYRYRYILPLEFDIKWSTLVLKKISV